LPIARVYSISETRGVGPLPDTCVTPLHPIAPIQRSAPLSMKNKSKLNNLQILRAFAAVAVTLFHTRFTFPYLRPFGSFGVDVFFVISGYIMARILDPQSDSSSDHFFRRRLLRIGPPYWFLTLLLYCAALRFPELMGATRASWVDLVKSLLFVPFMKDGAAIQPLLFLGWTLNYEMFFYFALFIGILTGQRVSRRISPVWFGAALVLAIFFASIPLAGHSVVAKFYSNAVVLEFLLGILSYYFCRSTESAGARLRLPLLAICITAAVALIAEQAILLQPSATSPLVHLAALAVTSFFLVTSASLLSLGGWDSKLTAFVLVGDSSYILYLIHPYCELSLDRVLSPNHHWLKVNTATGAFIGVTLSILIAVFLHWYVERPTVRFLNLTFGGKRRSSEFAPS
jgi:exopolysaccharide production protein ExoZ